MSYSWEVIKTIQEDSGSSGANQIIKVNFKVGYTKESLTSWTSSIIDLPNTNGSFQDIDSITKEQLITWVKAIITEKESETERSISWYEGEAEREWDNIKASYLRETNNTGTNEKKW